MDSLIAHLSVDRAIIDRSRNNKNCAIDELRNAEFAQSIDRAAIEYAQSVDCLRSRYIWTSRREAHGTVVEVLSSFPFSLFVRMRFCKYGTIPVSLIITRRGNRM